MPKLIETEFDEVVAGLPSVVEFDAKSEIRGGQGEELFLCTLGFEDRSLGVAKDLSASGYTAKNSLYLTYSTNVEDNDRNKKDMVHELSHISGGNIFTLCCDDTMFGENIHKFLKRNSSDGLEPNVTIDISTFSSRALLQIISIILSYRMSVRILYSEPAWYHPTEEEYQQEGSAWLVEGDKALDVGVGRIVPSQEAQGQHLEKAPEALFLFAGFSGARSKAVLNEIDAQFVENPASDRLVWFIGKPRDVRNEWRVGAVERMNSILSTSNKEIVETLSYKETMRRLEANYQRYWRDCNITVGNFGSKLQTIGISLYSHARPDIRVLNVIPKSYNAKRYSEGVGVKWKLELGGTEALSAKLRSIGQLALI